MSPFVLAAEYAAHAHLHKLLRKHNRVNLKHVMCEQINHLSSMLY